MIEQLFPTYRIVEWRDGAVFRTEPCADEWLPVPETVVGQELPDGRRVGTPDTFKVRRA